MTRRRITSTIALTLTLAAGAAPIATADPPPLASAASCGDVCSGHGYGPVSTPATVLRVAAPGDGGFDWGDAGIGAGSAFVLTIIAAGGVLTATNRRRRRIHHQHVSATS